jgi:hypothetical protein
LNIDLNLRALLFGNVAPMIHVSSTPKRHGCERSASAPTLCRDAHENRFGRLESGYPSMRKLLDESSVAQCLDGLPSGGEPAFPRNKRDLNPLSK